jgi:hypothetical protein
MRKTLIRPIHIYELLLAKISLCRYTNIASLIRYLHAPVALTVKRNIAAFSTALWLSVTAAALAGTPTFEAQPSPSPGDENSHDLFSWETTYTFRSDFKDSKLGHGDSLYDDFSYDHRFLITGKWYFRAGAEYERYDFGGTDNGLPDHLQAVYGHIALEYVVKDHAGAGIELEPGVYFQDNVTGDAFDIPGKVFVTFPLKKDKIFAVVGLGWSLFQDPPVAPGGGIIWLFSDKLRLQAVFPKPALVYQPNDDWEFRAQGEATYASFRTDDVITPERRLQLHDALVQYSEYRAGFQVGYSGLKHFKLIAAAGVTIRRNFDFFRVEQSKRTDPAPYIRVAAEANF